jgi:hypothetical protein
MGTSKRGSYFFTIPRYRSTKAKRYITRKRGLSMMAEKAVIE